MLPALQAVSGGALSASGIVSSDPCQVQGIFVTAASATPTIAVYDGTSASGARAVNTFTPVANTFYPLSMLLRHGCYIVIGGTVTCHLFTNPIPAGASG